MRGALALLSTPGAFGGAYFGQAVRFALPPKGIQDGPTVRTTQADGAYPNRSGRKVLEPEVKALALTTRRQPLALTAPVTIHPTRAVTLITFWESVAPQEGRMGETRAGMQLKRDSRPASLPSSLYPKSDSQSLAA